MEKKRIPKKKKINKISLLIPQTKVTGKIQGCVQVSGSKRCVSFHSLCTETYSRG